MAKTAFATGDALTKKLWEEKLFRDTVKESYFSRFMGESEENIVQVETKLTKEKGDKVTFGIVRRLSGLGVTSGQILEGNEEALVTDSFAVTLEQYRHAVRDKGKLDRQRVTFSIDTVSQQKLRDWGAEKIDSLAFEALQNPGTAPTKVFYKTSGGVTANTAATAKGALTANDSKLTLAMISAIKAWAKTGGNRSYIPLRPVKVEGRKYYVFLTHPDCLYDLRNNDSAFQQAMREAEIRGPSNPLFTGATAIWDGVVVHEHENCYIAADGGSGSVAWAKSMFLGAQALVWAWGAREEVVDETFDYKNEHGFAWGIMAGVAKPIFSTKDYGSLPVYLARTNISGL